MIHSAKAHNPSIHFLAWSLTILSVACGDENPSSSDSTMTGVETPDFDTISGSTQAGTGIDDGGGIGDGGLDRGDDGASTPTGDPDACVAVTQTADVSRQSGDIIFAIDNSASMRHEIQAVKENMNRFSQQISDSGVDSRIVLIANYPETDENFGGVGDSGICIDPPLGSGGCPHTDSNPPAFTHINDRVGSRTAWDRILKHYPDWSTTVRPDANINLVIISDDTSRMTLEEFNANFQALDPGLSDYVQHSIVCHTDCEFAAAIGAPYIELSNLTGGVAADLCEQDFQPVFDAIAGGIISGATLDCKWSIPLPPDGMDLDPNEVNVEFSDGMGAGFEIGAVPGQADCDGVSDGWYYDDPDSPSSIEVCPQTCERIQGFQAGQIDIAFGCETETAPPVG